MTGRAAGYCAGYPTPGFLNPVPGRSCGFGRGRGFGRGLGFRWGRRQAAAGVPPYAGPASEQQEADALRNQAANFQDALDGIRKRIADIEAKAGKQD
jgi:hypothetical protein